MEQLDEALDLVRGASDAGVLLRLAGGLAVRVLCPGFPPRAHGQQDLDLASVSGARAALTRFLLDRGYEPDRRFNALYGHKQLYFASPNGRSIDVLVDRLDMCHVVEFANRIQRLPITLDVADLLLSKLQIVELNEKDAQDALYLLSAYPVAEGDEPGTIGLGRICDVVADDWGWWRTLTGNLERILGFADDHGSRILPREPPYDAAEQLRRIEEAARRVPKGLRWKLRSKVGERVRWYRVPEEQGHD